MFHIEREQNIIHRALEELAKETGLRAKVLRWEAPLGKNHLPFDAVIEIANQHHAHQFAAEVKVNIDRYAVLLHLRHFAAHGAETAKLPFVIVTTFVTPQAAEQCRKLDLCFLDTAGNAYLKTPDLHVYVTGKKRPHDLAAGAEEGRAMTPAGLRILFTFLCDFRLLNAKYREIATAARVALGTIGPVIRDLEIRKHITPVLTNMPGNKRRILDPERLFREWVTAYPTRLRPKLNTRRFRAREPNWTQGLDLTPYRAYWGGEVAAARLTHYLAPQMATVYAQDPTTRLILGQKMKADINGDVELLNVFWNPEQLPRFGDVVPPILAYADLMTTTDGRNIETAKIIYDEYIGPHLRNQA
jgi:hypothetical protein